MLVPLDSQKKVLARLDRLPDMAIGIERERWYRSLIGGTNLKEYRVVKPSCRRLNSVVIRRSISLQSEYYSSLRHVGPYGAHVPRFGFSHYYLNSWYFNMRYALLRIASSRSETRFVVRNVIHSPCSSSRREHRDLLTFFVEHCFQV